MTHAGLISLVPALVTIIVAMVTHRVALAVFSGILAGSIAVVGVSVGASLPLEKFMSYLGASFGDVERLKIALFVMLMGALVEVVAQSGAYLKLSETFRRFLNTPRKGRLASVFLGICVFFDDYANLLIAGTSMRGLGASLRMSPGLHGYLVDQMATIVSLMFISTWAAYEGSLMVAAGEVVGLKGTPTQFLMNSLPYHVFTVLGIGLAIIVAIEGRWFGASFDLEPDKAVKPVKVVGNGASLWHGVIPLLTMVGITVAGVIYYGNEAWVAGKGQATLIDLLAQVPTIRILLVATIMAHLVASTLLIYGSVMTSFQWRRAVFQGLGNMISAGMVILLAKGLSNVSGDLGTGQYLADLAKGFMVPAVVPALVFVVSFLVSVATGFSWSSMAIVMPVAYQMAFSVGGAGMIPFVSGAVVSGSIAGGMVVPYSDTTVMASAAFNMPPVYHAKTQMPQVLVVSGVAVIGYVMLALQLPVGFTYGCCFIALYAIHSIYARESVLTSVDSSQLSGKTKCPKCWAEMLHDAQFCGVCGRPLASSEAESGWEYTESTDALMHGVTWFAAAIGIVVFLVTSIPECPTCHKARWDQILSSGTTCRNCYRHSKACYANIRVITGATEMYNMDHSTMIDRINDSDVKGGGILVKGQYLKSAISPPLSGCSYSGTKLTGNGKVVCVVHGAVED